jgi:hypothetical protein
VGNLIQAEFQASIYSAYMRLLPFFENYLLLVEKLAEQNFPTVVFLAEGPTGEEFYERLLSEALVKNSHIVKVVPRDSPVELWIALQERADLIYLLALFLCTRIKVEVSTLQALMLQEGSDEKTSEIKAFQRIKVGEGSQGSVDAATTSRSKMAIVSFESGLATESPDRYRLRVHALFPKQLSISVLFELKLGLVFRLRAVLVELLKPHKSHEVSSSPQ